MCEKGRITKEEKIIYQERFDYSQYYKDYLLKEEPFYRKGMTVEEAKQEIDYLNDNLNMFYNGEYMPLWRQNLYK